MARHNFKDYLKREFDTCPKCSSSIAFIQKPLVCQHCKEHIGSVRTTAYDSFEIEYKVGLRLEKECRDKMYQKLLELGLITRNMSPVEQWSIYNCFTHLLNVYLEIKETDAV